MRSVGAAKRTLAAVAATSMVIGASSCAQAQFEYGLFVGPPIPSAFGEYAVRVRALTTGGPVTVESIVTQVNGGSVDVTAYVSHGSTFTSPTVYAATVIGPPREPGVYSIRYFTAERNFGQGDYHSTGVPQYTTTVIVSKTDALGDATEYYHAGLDHYFVTTLAGEIAALDSGVLSGWIRTGQKLSGVFVVDPSIGATQAPVTPVCRFYGLPSAGLNTHFFSASPDECAAVAANWPDRWQLETSTALYVYQARATDGGCPDATWPVYRLYNNRPDVNHRYTTSLVIRQQMIDQGWIAEGYGGTSVAMCIQGP